MGGGREGGRDLYFLTIIYCWKNGLKDTVQLNILLLTLSGPWGHRSEANIIPVHDAPRRVRVKTLLCADPDNLSPRGTKKQEPTKVSHIYFCPQTNSATKGGEAKGQWSVVGIGSICLERPHPAVL